MGGDMSMMPEKERETLTKHFGEDLASFGSQMVRSMSYFLHQNWHVGLLSFGSRDADEYVELSKFDPSIPLHVYLGTDDNMWARSSSRLWIRSSTRSSSSSRAP